METLFMLLCFSVFIHVLFTCTTAVDTLAVNQTIRDGQTIVSAIQTFELGFFSPSNNSQTRYLGIWYKQVAPITVVWIANRETPITNKFGELTLRPDGVLVLSDSNTNKIIWVSISWRTIRNNPAARLLGDGNLMVIDGEDGRDTFVWQSFDYPTDTQIPGMPCGWNLERGTYSNITSRKSIDDPSKGRYTIYMDLNGLPQIYEMDGDNIQYRLGSWNGILFAGTTNEPNPVYESIYVSNERETYSGFIPLTQSLPSRVTLSPEGNMLEFNWNNSTQRWVLYSSLTTDMCERYKLCGDYGGCDISKSPNYCGCLKGFTPKKPDQWDVADWSSGCQREIPLNCSVGEGFRKYSNMKIPDTRRSWFDKNMTVEECKVKCRNECNCTAYATLNIKLGTGCLLWYNELVDMRIIHNKGQDIFIRMAAVELEKDKVVPGNKIQPKIVVITVIVGIISLLGLFLLIIWMKKLKAQGKHRPISQDFFDLPFFSFASLVIATDNFCIDNKLGEGGFGPVYKGSWESGEEIAVKRLSTSSTQGVEEFKNEVKFLSMLQHRNLVKILGCCVEGEQKLLVYEFMTNGGLDLFLFEPSEGSRLDWSQRFHIINGIARGLLYLHQDSPLQVIHRDLKASNILLDGDMNPKIADFGLARSFLGTEIETINTKRVVGTYGYMSPEYAGDGIFSVKSDVFSFGVLMLEIISGKKNRLSSDQTQTQNLLGHTWRLFKKGMAFDLADEYVIKSTDKFEVLRSIHVGLLCVQHNPHDRPNMSTVVMMLSNNSLLSEPKKPGFYTEASKLEDGTTSCLQTLDSSSNDTTTLLEASSL